jgi:hypothetical protein
MAEFNPRIVGFLCNWCSFAGADLAGTDESGDPLLATFTEREPEDVADR